MTATEKPMMDQMAELRPLIPIMDRLISRIE